MQHCNLRHRATLFPLALPRAPEPRLAFRWGYDIVDDLLLPGRIAGGDFGGWMRDAMAERRITQRALAMRTGINHSTISRLLASGHMPSLSTAIAIVKVLGSRPRRPGSASSGPYASTSGGLGPRPEYASSDDASGMAAAQRRE